MRALLDDACPGGLLSPAQLSPARSEERGRVASGAACSPAQPLTQPGPSFLQAPKIPPFVRAQKGEEGTTYCPLSWWGKSACSPSLSKAANHRPLQGCVWKEQKSRTPCLPSWSVFPFWSYSLSDSFTDPSALSDYKLRVGRRHHVHSLHSNWNVGHLIYTQ